MFIPINTESSFQDIDKFSAPVKKSQKPSSKFAKSQIELPKSNKEKAGTFFKPEKLVKPKPSLSPSTLETAKPTAQVLPYDFRPGSLDIFGEVKKQENNDSKNVEKVPEEDFKYESENDLESIIKVPSEYTGKSTRILPHGLFLVQV